MSENSGILLLCHQGSYEQIYQATSCAAAAASGGRRVDLVFYFEALDRLLNGRLDSFELMPRDSARESQYEFNGEERGVSRPSALLASAREQGARVFACSASLGLLGRDPLEALESVDEVVGWPTVLQLMDRAGQLIYL